MKKLSSFLSALLTFVLFPDFVHAQTVGTPVTALQKVLDSTYNNMMPLVSNLISTAQGVAAFGLIFYIGFRVWKHIARAEAIDFFPLLRPFVIVLVIGLWPQILNALNDILTPTITSTAAIVSNENADIHNLLANQLSGSVDTSQQVLVSPYMEGDVRNMAQYQNPNSTDGTTSSSSGGFWSTLGSGIKFMMSGVANGLKFILQFYLSIILQLIYYAASLCIQTVRTFHLILLAILGPFALAFSCYDGMQNSLSHWFTKYINIYLWLPVSNILGAILAQIQLNMLKLDPNTGIGTYVVTDEIYILYLIIGIVAYTTVPGITNYIVHTHIPNALMQKVTSLAGSAVSMAVTGTPSAGGGAGGGGGPQGGAAGGATGTTTAGGSQFNHDKIAG